MGGKRTNKTLPSWRLANPNQATSSKQARQKQALQVVKRRQYNNRQTHKILAVNLQE